MASVEPPADRSREAAAAGAPRPGSLLHLLALSGLVFAQPLLDLLGRQPEFFAIQRFAPGQIVALALAAVFLVPLPLLALAAAARLRPRFGRAVHLALIAVLLSLLALLALRRSPLDGGLWLAAGLAAGVLAALVYRRHAWARQLVGFTALGLILFPAAFLLAPGIRRQLAAGPAARLAPPSGSRTPIVLVVADELTATDLLDQNGRLDARAFPHLAALAADGTWFAHALTISDVTELAVPALLTGVFPRGDLLPTAQDYPRNLFSALPDYRIWASEPITRMADTGPPRGLTARSLAPLAADLAVVYGHLLLPRKWRAQLPTLADRWSGFAEPARGARPAPGMPVEAIEALHADREAQFDSLLAALDPDSPRSLYFLHILLPHTPWEFLPSGRRYLTPRSYVPGLSSTELASDFWARRESFALEAYHRYLLQTQYLDRRIGDLVRRLRETGLYDDALVVFTADHGTSFRAGDSRRALTAGNEPDILPVPLILKRPGQRRGEVVSRRVSTLDLLPTLLDAIGVRPPWPLERRSLLAAHPDPPPQRIFAKHHGPLPLPADLDRRVLERLRFRLEHFAVEGDPPARIVLRRPAGSLVGRPLATLDLAPTPVGSLRLDASALPEADQARGGFAPAWVGGTVRLARPGPDCCELAVALGGRIVATTHTDDAAGEHRFGALVPEWDLGSSSGTLEVLRVESEEPARLVPFRVEGGGRTTTELVLDEDGSARAVLRDGEEIGLRAGSTRGFFDLRTDGALTLATGWAFDLEQRAEPSEILAFQGARLVASGAPSGVREDVNSSLGIHDPKFRTAFELPIAAAQIPGLERSGLRIVALGRAGAAGELEYFRYLRTDSEGRPDRVEFTDGRRFPLAAEALDGALLDWRESADGTVIRGWAWDPRHAAAATRVLAFDGERAVYDTVQLETRPALAARVGAPDSARLAFELLLPAPRSLGGPLEHRPVVVALSRDGRARILER